MAIYISKWTHGVPEISIFGSKSGVQRWSCSERTVNAKENLIWYSESQENFLSDTLHPSDTYSSCSWSILRLKMPNFHFFTHFASFLRRWCTFAERIGKLTNCVPKQGGDVPESRVLTNAFISSTVQELVTFTFTVCQSDPIFLVPKPTDDISILGYKFKNYLFFVFRIKKLLRNISSMSENLRNF